MSKDLGLTLDQLSNAIRTVGESVGQSTVAVRIQRPGPVASPAYRGDSVIASAGSGIVLSETGLVVTAAHVIALADRVTVTLADGRSTEAEVLGADEPTDLALLRLPLQGLSPIRLASEDDVSPGRIVLAVGRPPGFGIALTVGVISASERSIRNTVGGLLENVIQASVPIGPGTSGGPLADVHGQLVGINTAAAEMAWGLSFAIPAETVRWVSQALLDFGVVRRVTLGLTGETVRLSPELAARHGHATAVAVKGLRSGMPAAQAGVCDGDVLLRIGGEPVPRLGVLHRLLGSVDEAQRSICLDVLREDRVVTLEAGIERCRAKQQSR